MKVEEEVKDKLQNDEIFLGGRGGECVGENEDEGEMLCKRSALMALR